MQRIGEQQEEEDGLQGWLEWWEKERDVVNLSGLMFAVLPHATHPSDKQSVHFQLAHVTSSPLRITPLCLSLVFQ